MSQFSEIVMNNKLYNSSSTGFIKKLATVIDQKLGLEPDEIIQSIYADKMPFVGAQVVIATNIRAHIYLKDSFSVHELEEVHIRPGLFGQTNVTAKISGKDKDLILYKAYDTEDEFGKDTKSIINREKLQNLEYPFEETGFRISSHLNFLIDILDDDEDVLFLFVGLAENWGGASTACAVTNKDTIVFASKGLLGNDNLKRIKISDIKEVSVSSTLILNDIVEVETLTEKFGLNFSGQEQAIRVQNILRKYISRFEKENRSSNSTVLSSLSPADEIKKFKALLDEGIISEQEFDEKKKQLLGL